MRILHTDMLSLLLIIVLLGGSALAETECSDPIPGVRDMIYGVDITELDLTPVRNTFDRGFRRPVVEFTCNRGREWVYPSSPEKIRYQLPDQVWSQPKLKKAGWMKSKETLYKTHKEVREFMTEQVDVKGVWGPFSLSGSESTIEIQNSVTNKSRYTSHITAYQSETEVYLLPRHGLNLDVNTQRFIDQDITGDYSSHPSQYKKFIDMFGTHYFSSGNFGGYINVMHEIEKSYISTHEEEQVKRNIKASYMNSFLLRFSFKLLEIETLFSAGIEIEWKDGKRLAKVDSEFLEKSTQLVTYYGGNANLLTYGGINEWQSSVHKYPWLCYGELEPISDLIQNDTKKSSMREAAKQYILKKYLDDPLRLINYAEEKILASHKAYRLYEKRHPLWVESYGYPINVTILDTLKNKIREMQSKDLVETINVRSLERDVEYHVIVPDWFKTTTELCFNWVAAYSFTQCKDEFFTPMPNCVKPNHMTRIYQDRTDNQPGGCKMQWGIKSEGFEPWFRHVKICYKGSAQSYLGEDQCDGVSRVRPRCASINSFTNWYLDDTNNLKPGGCFMSWRLVVPKNAPFWMLTAKFCLYWEPVKSDDTSSCGLAHGPMEICAMANKWTPDYLDNTRNEGAGCRMKWGIKTVL